jgi:hypothetical protein
MPLVDDPQYHRSLTSAAPDSASVMPSNTQLYHLKHVSLRTGRDKFQWRVFTWKSGVGDNGLISGCTVHPWITNILAIQVVGSARCSKCSSAVKFLALSVPAWNEHGKVYHPN